MKHLILTLLLMFSTTASALKLVDYKKANGFAPHSMYVGCKDPDGTLKDKSDSTTFICASFVANGNAYLAFADNETYEVLELYKFDPAKKEFVLLDDIYEPLPVGPPTPSKKRKTFPSSEAV